MLEEILADLKSVEIADSDVLANALSKMDLYSGSVDIKDLLKKHLGQ